MNLWLVSNIRLEPSRGLKASALQNLRTAAALAELGHRVLLWCDRIAPGGTAWAESQLAQSFPPTLTIRQAAARGQAGEKRSAFGATPDRVWNLLRGRLAGGRPDAIISRSPSVLRQLRASRLRPASTRLILELQYPEWSFLWRDWAARHPAAGLHEARNAMRGLRAQEHRGYAAADGILYAARAHERLLERAGYAGPARWIPSGCEPPDEMTSGAEAEFDLGYVGTLARENGIEALVRAVAGLKDRRLLIVGDGRNEYTERLKSVAGELGVGDRIVFAGSVPPGEVRTAMRRCRIGVVPISARCGSEKRQYASPLKLIEWMAAGVPVAASSVPSIVQHAAEGEPIAFFEPDRSASMAACLHDLLQDRDRRRSMARDGLKAADRRSFVNRAKLVTTFAEALSDGCASNADAGVGGHGG